ncbi:MAG: hypothetical protein GXY41_01250 [Phycisphaerae bacterium]|nr:hypothetical protein [Phycisphaerae bacterium]
MFSINEAIEGWKQELAGRQTMIASDIEELEAHLQDEMDSLSIAGLSEEESFVIASRRIGNPDSICQEFAKINATVIWRNRFFWMIMGIVLIQIISKFASFFAFIGTIIGCQLIGWNPLIVGVISAGIQFAIMLWLCLGLYFAAVKLSVFQRLRQKTQIRIIIVVIGLNVLLGVLLNLGVRFWYTALLVRLGAEKVGQIAIGDTYKAFGLSILWPIVWLTLLIWLMPKKTPAEQRQTAAH